MMSFTPAKVNPELENALKYMSELTGLPKSSVLGMCLSVVNQYSDEQILMEMKAHTPPDLRKGKKEKPK